MSQTNDQWMAALRAVFAKATTDADFRAKCLAEPIAALREASGLELPPNSQVKFSETSDGTGIALPAFGSDPDEILDAEILEDIAGGYGTDHKYCASVHYC